MQLKLVIEKKNSFHLDIDLPNEQARLDILKIHAGPITKHGEIGKFPRSCSHLKALFYTVPVQYLMQFIVNLDCSEQKFQSCNSFLKYNPLFFLKHLHTVFVYFI